MISSARTSGFSYGLNYSLVLFLLSLENSFNIICKAGLLATNSLSLCLSWNVFNFFSILKMVLIGIGFLVDGLFSFSVWKMSSHCFLVSMVFDKMVPVVENSLHVMSHSASFKILSLDSLTMICLV